MTKKDLVKIIREVVKQEVKKEVSKILIREQRTSAVSSKKSKPIVRKKPRGEKVKYTSNSTLNDILNETVGGIEGERGGTGEMDEYPTLGGGVMDTSRMTELMGYGKSEDMKRDMVAVDTLQKAGVRVDQVPEHLTNALTRDYSGLMKALDKKKGA